MPEKIIADYQISKLFEADPAYGNYINTIT